MNAATATIKGRDGSALVKKDYVAATTSLKKAAEKSSARGPGIQANVYTWLGRAYAGADDHKTAAATYSEALAITNEFPSTYFFMGRSMKALGENAAAKEAFSKYIAADPQGTYIEEAKASVLEL